MNCSIQSREADDCRTRLIKAATEAFLEEGYRASVDRIASRAGVAKQTLYNNFVSKEELFREVGKLLAESVAMELCATQDGLPGSLKRFGLELREKTLSDAGIAMYRSFHVEGARVPEMAAAIHGRVVARLAELLAGYLGKAMKNGELKQDDPLFAAEMLIAMLVHSDRAKRLAGQARRSEKEERQQVEKVVTCFLQAFSTTSSNQTEQSQRSKA